MPISAPVAASGSRSAAKRQHRIPEAVKAACLMMIQEPADFLTAARANKLKPDTLRRWLHRPEVVGFLRRERAAFRHAICSANDRVLAAIRDELGGNAMAKVHAIKTLESLDEETSVRPGASQTPGVVIRIVNMPATAPPMVDVTPRPALPASDEDCSDEALTR